MIDRIAHLDVFNPQTGRLRDRLVIIDPTHEPAPALNMFRLPIAAASDAHRNRIRNQLIEMFSYIFSTSDAKITQRQSIPFAFVVRLVFSMGGDINTLMDLLEEDAKHPRFTEEIERLSAVDEGARRFFAKDFYSSAFNETRQQIKTRLYEIISVPNLWRCSLRVTASYHFWIAISRGK